MKKDKKITKKEKETLQNNFKSINTFFDKNTRAPRRNKKNIYEYQLGAYLFNIKKNKAFVEMLKTLDQHNLLKKGLKI